MPSWWGKSSSKRTTNKESIFDTIQRKFRNAAEDSCNGKSGGTKRYHGKSPSGKGCRSTVPSRSTSPLVHVSRSKSLEQRSNHSQLLPLPDLNRATINDGNHGICKTSELQRDRSTKPSQKFPIAETLYASLKRDSNDTERDIVTTYVSSDNSLNTGDSSDSHLFSHSASDCENGSKANTNSSYRMVQKDQSHITVQETSKAAPQVCNSKHLHTSTKGSPLYPQDRQIKSDTKGLPSALNSSRSFSSISSMRSFGPDQVLNLRLSTGNPSPDIASGHCSSSSSGHNSSHNFVSGETSRQIFWQQNKCSPECSPKPSQKMRSPSPSSKIHCASSTPMRQRARNAIEESAARHHDDAKQETHRLPLPLITITSPSPFSPTYSVSSTPSAHRSPVRRQNPTSPGSHWKKGKLLGRGTFGHVFLGFNSQSGELCAMKEVPIFYDDPKSMESVQQLEQEIALLSRFRHPNIVQYYGSEMVDDRLYIYLEYVSGGSIYKLLQQYGEFSEIVVRNYTRQILFGLAYLHAKNTVHRDIKGANILVDPNGWIKLADFGIAKHISGHSSPFSFKGSPYWMAPEVIKNTIGCNLAVDIWSLGCTVLEMATTKPPWSDYEGVAAMFKIGISKDNPTIPDHLSEDGKDFVRLCLQRNPQNRPSAAQLLEHPFVNNVTPERPILTNDPSDAQAAIINAVRSLLYSILCLLMRFIFNAFFHNIIWKKTTLFFSCYVHN
ncbi:putative mitogen-activated protein kinase kinase kinase STE-STE11 family [Lupinus albus]|uniref:mitogen-activated protein kinase kinase kinase n=1 Tax=Lupinus albus TaxID=3870 RepID=A0A6A4NYY8_LUPAL|nr:putative mitogen-activated protein kinase kinase kinase STE-STE11 family [Lupinus albus]